MNVTEELTLWWLGLLQKRVVNNFSVDTYDDYFWPADAKKEDEAEVAEEEGGHVQVQLMLVPLTENKSWHEDEEGWVAYLMTDSSSAVGIVLLF